MGQVSNLPHAFSLFQGAAHCDMNDSSENVMASICHYTNWDMHFRAGGTVEISRWWSFAEPPGRR